MWMIFLRVLCIAWMFVFIAFQPLVAQDPFQLTGANQDGQDPVQIFEEICFGDGIEIVDIDFEGVDAAVGTFTGGTPFVGLGEGIIMTTGFVNTEEGNIGADFDVEEIANVYNMSTATYPLEDLANSDIQFDVAVYRITFIPSSDSIRFNYVFASDEYLEFVCSPFNDVFGFFLEGPDESGNVVKRNLALVPGTDLPVSINTINNGESGADTSTAEEEYCTEPVGSLNYTHLFNLTTETPTYNGYTDVLMANSAVIPCQTYTIEMVIADIGDQLWDSGVFIEAHSFCSFGSPQAAVLATEKVLLVEGCDHPPLEVDLSELEETDFPITYTIAGTAENGVDFDSIGLSGEITFGTTNWELSLNTLSDTLSEGIEQLTVTLEAACFSQTYNICILDPLTIEGDAVGECSDDPFNLSVVADYDTDILPDDWATTFEFEWSDGQSGQSIEVFPTENTAYTVTYSSAFNEGCTAAFEVEVINPEGFIAQTLCMEDPGIAVNGTIYNFDQPVGTEILPGGSVNGCDSIIQIALTFYPNTIQLLDATIDEGETYFLGDDSFQAAGTYELIFSDQNGCDSLVVLNLDVNTFNATIIDTLIVGDEEEFCFDNAIFNTISSFQLFCDSDTLITESALDTNALCLGYTGIAPGIDTLCVEICDELGTCDTTFFNLYVFTNLLDAVDDFDTTALDQPILVDVLANDWTSATVLTDQYLVNQPAYGDAVLNDDGTITYTPAFAACLVEDQFSYAICNEIGCDTAVVYIWLDNAEDLCDGVWPGDVGDDGEVNQLDFWAVGLGFGSDGPQRPNATIEWIGQPMVDWGETITFIYEIDLKYADCNGDGAVNETDYEAIEQNWGLTHNLQANNYNFPTSNHPFFLGTPQVNQAGWLEIPLQLGTAEQPLKKFYGLSFEINLGTSGLDHFIEWEESWIGLPNTDYNYLYKKTAGKHSYMLVRNDQLGRAGYGPIAKLVIPNYTDAFDISITQIQLLQIDQNIYNLESVNSQVDMLSTSANTVSVNNKNIKVYPNPASHFVWVDWSETLAVASYQLLNVQGQILVGGAIQGSPFRINTTTLEPGVYFLQLQGTKGRHTIKLLIN